MPAFRRRVIQRAVLSTNLHRRHLNESQRAMVGAKLETMDHGGDRRSQDQDANLHLDRAEAVIAAATSHRVASEMVDVSPRSIADGKKVLDKAAAVLVQRVEQGEVAVSLAAKIADLPMAEQDALADADEATLRGAVKKSRRAERDMGDATRAASAALFRVFGMVSAATARY